MDATERILELHELAEPAQIIVGMIRQAERDLARIRTHVENWMRPLDSTRAAEILTELGISGDSVDLTQLDVLGDSVERRSIEVDRAIVQVAKEIIDWALEKIETLRIALQGRVPALYAALSNAKMALLQAKNMLPWSRMESKPLFEALRKAQNDLHSAAEELAAIPELDKPNTRGGATQLVDPPHEIGWTASSLRQQVKLRADEALSDSTLKRIREAAKVKARKNAHEKFKGDEVEAMIRVAAHGTTLWCAAARAWREMLIECEGDATTLSRQ